MEDNSCLRNVTGEELSISNNSVTLLQSILFISFFFFFVFGRVIGTFLETVVNL